MKKNKMMRMASGLLVATLLTTSMISGTFAKYTTAISGSDTARVAKWDVAATVGNDVFGEASTTVNLFKAGQIYDNKDADYTAQSPAQDSDVKSDEAIIAPGTWGKFTYTLTNKSEVSATYAVKYDIEEKQVPLEWSTDGTTWNDTLSNISETAIAMNGGSQNITVYWRWAFTDETNETTRDTADTGLGTASALAEPSVKITVTFTQVN